MGFLRGKRTYIVAILCAAATLARAFDIIDTPMLIKIDAFLAPLGLAFLRAGICSK